MKSLLLFNMALEFATKYNKKILFTNTEFDLKTFEGPSTVHFLKTHTALPLVLSLKKE